MVHDDNSGQINGGEEYSLSSVRFAKRCQEYKDHINQNGRGVPIRDKVLQAWVKTTRTKFTKEYETSSQKLFTPEQRRLLQECKFASFIKHSALSEAMREVLSSSKDFFKQNKHMDFYRPCAKFVKQGGGDRLPMLCGSMDILIAHHKNSKLGKAKCLALKKEMIDMDKVIEQHNERALNKLFIERDKLYELYERVHERETQKAHGLNDLSLTITEVEDGRTATIGSDDIGNRTLDANSGNDNIGNHTLEDMHKSDLDLAPDPDTTSSNLLRNPE